MTTQVPATPAAPGTPALPQRAPMIAPSPGPETPTPAVPGTPALRQQAPAAAPRTAPDSPTPAAPGTPALQQQAPEVPLHAEPSSTALPGPSTPTVSLAGVGAMETAQPQTPPQTLPPVSPSAPSPSRVSSSDPNATAAPRCGICLCDMMPASEELEALHCGHCFHAECLQKYMDIGGCDREHACVYKCHMSAVHVSEAAAPAQTGGEQLSADTATSAPLADAGGPAARPATATSPTPTRVRPGSTTSPRVTLSPHDVDPSQDSVSGDEEQPGGR